MFLDSFKLHRVIIQINYENAFELWDNAGQISRELNKIWGNLKLDNAQPASQTLIGDNVSIQTSLDKSTITLDGESSFDERSQQNVKETFEVWRLGLNLQELKRLSTRSLYVKDFSSIKEANAELFDLNLAKWPAQKVFDQPQESELNTFDLNYRFEDESSFTLLRFRTEWLKIEAKLSHEFDRKEITNARNRLVVDYDRGLLKNLDAEKLRITEWLKGYNHLIRRDIDKIFK